jgi:integrase
MLTPYLRGETWWVKGRVEYNGLPITGYIRESTGASTKAGATQWISNRQQAEERRYLLGDDHAEAVFTFNDAVLLYKCGPDMAKYLAPLVSKLGPMPVKAITPKLIRDLGAELYPKNSTDSWRRWVIAPARAVINNAHHLGKCGYLRVDGYSKAERVKQDKARGKRSRVKKVPGSWEWLLAFRQHASRRHGAIALFMFATGARIGQAVAMTPDHLLLDESKAIIPGAKGHDDRTVTLPPELVAELLALPPRVPRGWDRRRRRTSACSDGRARTARARAGYAPASSPAFRTCRRTLPAATASGRKCGSAERGQEGRRELRRVVAEGDMVDRTYTHEENSDDKILEAFRTGRVQAEKTHWTKTGRFRRVSGMKGSVPPKAEATGSNPVGCATFPRRNLQERAPNKPAQRVQIPYSSQMGRCFGAPGRQLCMEALPLEPSASNWRVGHGRLGWRVDVLRRTGRIWSLGPQSDLALRKWR